MPADGHRGPEGAGAPLWLLGALSRARSARSADTDRNGSGSQMIDRRTFGKAIGAGAAGTAAASLTGLSHPPSAAASSSTGPGADRAATAPTSHTGGGSFPALRQVK